VATAVAVAYDGLLLPRTTTWNEGPRLDGAVTSYPCRSARQRRTLEKTKGGAVATQSERVLLWVVAVAVILVVAAYFLLILIGTDVPSPF
jgi:hypothetical protein